MHSQHIESTSGHTVNISGAPPPKLIFNTLYWGAESHAATQMSKRHGQYIYILCSILHVHPNIKYFFSLLHGLNNEGTSIFWMAGLQNSRPTKINKEFERLNK